MRYDLVVEDWKKNEQIKKIVQAADPSYKRKTVRIISAESVTLMDLNWSGGTKSSYVGVTIDGVKVGDTKRQEAQFQAMQPRHTMAEGAELPIPENTVVVRYGFFCGKVSQLYIYARDAFAKELAVQNSQKLLDKLV